MTTINEPSHRLLTWIRDSAWRLVVVLDRKSPVEAWRSVESERITVLDLERQHARYPKLSALLPENSYSRKNLGFLEAFRTGAEIVWELDDDNFPIADARVLIDEAWFPLAHGDVFGIDESELASESLLAVNLYPAIYGEHCWPRGFPLDQIQTGRGFVHRLNVENSEPSIQVPDIVQFGIDGEPDFDAVFRLSYPQRVRTARDVRIALPGPFVAPCNTQNTCWVKFRRAMETGAIFHPCTVPDRFSDILKGYIAQVFFTLGFGPPTAYQARNEHSFFEDFRGEIEMYLNLRAVLDVVQSFSSSEIETSREIMALLVDGGIVDSRELVVLDAFLDCSSVC